MLVSVKLVVLGWDWLYVLVICIVNDSVLDCLCSSVCSVFVIICWLCGLLRFSIGLVFGIVCGLVVCMEIFCMCIVFCFMVFFVVDL